MSAARRLAAILAADVVGYSRLMGADEAGTAKVVRERREAATPIVRAFGGRLVKTTGDGVLQEFPSVVAAIECAIAIQKMMAESNAALPEAKRILYRVGVNLGDILIEGDDILGDGVNVAARLEGICEPGAICVSEDAWRQARGRIEAEFVDLGEQSLKNIAHPMRAYALTPAVIAAVKAASPAVGATIPAADAPKSRGVWARWPGLAAALALALLAAGTLGWRAGYAPRFMVASVDDKLANAPRLSIVVLPFANLSGEPAQDYLVDALTDALTTSLARISETFVIAHNTAMTFKGKPVDARAIGKGLGVRYVLEGSVQPYGSQVRVNAQLIDAESGAHVWAEQFDAKRTDLLQMQDEIVVHLARAMEITLTQAEADRVKRVPTARPDAEDLALQCNAAVNRAGFVGKDADAAYPLCEQALNLDPNNVRALLLLAVKYYMPVNLGISADPKADFKRVDELLSKALALDPNSGGAHGLKAWVLTTQARFEEAMAERERTLALDPADVGNLQGLAWDYNFLGQYEKGLETFDNAIRLSPRDPALHFMYGGKSWAYFGLMQYDQAIEWARRAISVNADDQGPHLILVGALALSGRETEAREALQRYLALPASERARTIATWKEHHSHYTNAKSDPRVLEMYERMDEALGKAGMPEGDEKSN